MSDLEKKLDELEGFFKTRVHISEIEEILSFAPSSLVGIDNVSNKKLNENNIKTIDDLANLSEENPPAIVGVPPNMIIKWIKVSNILKKAIFEQIKAEKKLLMVGLDNGGKTSLLNIIKHQFSREILPTKGVKREQLDFFGFPIISWDLGGQVQFREKWYFEKPELYFSESNIMIYVVDIQDQERFGESGEYLRRILEILNDLGEKVPILIVLNKSDPDIINTPIWEQSVKYIGELFNPILEQYGFNFDYAMTSIFQQGTVTQMFSNGVKKISETSEIIEHILRDFGKSINAIALSLISMEGLIFGTYSKKETDATLLNNTAMILHTLEMFYKSNGLSAEQTIIHDLPNNNLSMRGEKLFEYSIQKTPVFIWLLSIKTDISKEKLGFVKKELLPLVNLFL